MLTMKMNQNNDDEQKPLLHRVPHPQQQLFQLLLLLQKLLMPLELPALSW